jgi:hypothetical protein
MQKPFQRFELLLPTKFNNGLPVPTTNLPMQQFRLESLLPTRQPENTCFTSREGFAEASRPANVM